MNLPHGAHLAYIVTYEAWYWPTTRENRSITVESSHKGTGGGVSWEFVIDESPGIGIQVHMFDDSWDAWAQLPEFFAALRELPGRNLRGRPGVSLEDVRRVLDSLGAVDETDRQERVPQ